MSDYTDLLKTHLAVAVPIAIEDLRKQGGAEQWHVEEAQQHMQKMRIPGITEAIFYKDPGKTQVAMSHLTECLAVMAFTPGGVTFGDLHFEATEEQSQYMVSDIDAFLTAIEPFRQAMDREGRESPLREEYAILEQEVPV